MKKILLLLVVLVSSVTFAQNNGITYQAVIYSTTGESVPGIKNSNAPLANKAICLQFSIGDGNSSTEYQEKVTVTTDDFGMVNLVIGTGTQTGGFATSFNVISWASSQKYLKVSIDQSGNCTTFELISNQILTYVPYALAANSAASITGVVSIANGGTNATSVLGAKTNLSLQNVDNTTDLNKPLSTATQTALNTKVDKATGKELSTNDYTTVEKNKLAAITGTNTGDQDLSLYATTTSVALKANTADVTTNLATKVDKVTGKELSSNDYTTAEKIKLASLGGTQDLSSYATNVALTNKVDKVTGKELSSNDYTTIEKAKLAAITGNNTGDQDLSLYATTTSVALKANTADVTTNLATKVDKVTGKELSSNDYTTIEKAKLAAITGNNTGDQDLSLYATTTSLALKANISDVTTNLATKVDKVTGKELSSNDYTIVEKNKLAAITGINTGDQDLSSYATNVALATKVDKVTGKELSSNDYTTVEKTKLAAITGTNTGDQDLSSLATNVALATKVDKVTGKDLSTNDYTTVEKAKLAAITGTNTGDQDLSSYVTLTNLALKADIESPNLTGVPLAPTATPGTNTTQLATTAFVTDATTGKFVDITTNQTIAGNKTFSSDIVVNGIKVGNGGGNQSTIIGDTANGTLDNNTALGFMTLDGNSGTNNTAVGTNSMRNSGTTSMNTSVGVNSGTAVNSGNGNTYLGHNANVTNNSAISNATAIGAESIVTTSNTIQLGADGTNGTTPISNIKTSGTITAGTITYPNTDGASGQVLTTNGSGEANWSSPASISISSINGNSDVNGAVINNGILSLTPADATNGGIVTAGNQTLSGNKILLGSFEIQKTLDTAVLDIDANNPNSPVSAPDFDSRQSFIAGISGYLSNVNIKLFSSGTYTLTIYEGGNIMNENNPGGTQLFQTTFLSINSEISSIPVTNTLITAGNLYWFKLTSGTEIVVGLNWGQGNVGSGSTVSFPNYYGGLNDSWIFQTYVSQATGGGTLKAQGTITSSGFKTPTGTSSQYLMADGSVYSSSSSSAVPYTGATSPVNLGSYDLTVNNIQVGLGAGAKPSNTTVGNSALVSNTTGEYNTAFGYGALQSNTNGILNTAIGNSALQGNTGSFNTGLGKEALSGNTSGSFNTAIGTEALRGNTMGSKITTLGYQAEVASNNLSNATAIGAGAVVSADNTIQLGNTEVTNVNTSGSITANAAISSEITENLTIDNANAEQYKAKVLICNPTSPITITFGNDLPLGFNCMVLQKSADANKINLEGGSGVTLKNKNNFTATAGNYAMATIVNIGGGIIVTAGDMQ